MTTITVCIGAYFDMFDVCVCEMSMNFQISLQGVDIPAAHAVPLPFLESKVGALVVGFR